MGAEQEKTLAAALSRGGVIHELQHHLSFTFFAAVAVLFLFGMSDWLDHFFAVLIIIAAAVFILCCTSDILFPLLLVNKKGARWCAGDCHKHDVL